MEIIIILLLILLNGVFSMSEIALVSARKTRLEAAAGKGNRKARKALKLANNPNRFLSTVQIGITLIGILTGIYSGEKITDDVTAFINQFAALQPHSESIAITLVLILVTYFSLVLGELLPKRVGLIAPEAIAKSMAGPMELLSKITAPFIWLLTKTTDLLIRILGIKKTNESQVTEEEIRAIIQEGTSAGAIEEIEQDIVENVFHLGEKHASSLMTQRRDISWLDINETPKEIMTRIVETRHKLYPVCDGDLDNVKGILFIKEIFSDVVEGKPLDLQHHMKPAVFLPERMKAYRALEEMRRRKSSVSLIINEFGGVEGLLTINDIIDTLVTDFTEEVTQQEIIARADGSYYVDASISLSDFCRFFDIETDDEVMQNYQSVGGLVLDKAQRFPETGFRFHWSGLEIEVADLDGNRIDKLVVAKKPLEFDGEE